MSDEYYSQYKKESLRVIRVIHLVEEIWPAVYKIINELFYGIINFLKDVFSGLWPK